MINHDCEEEGHDWLFVGRAPDGTCFYRCRHCKIEGEI